ncbi:HD domain-containing protein [Candidatus Pacebacteria bacterium]|nr:HD domain-containing protein [Candidatus Paceibacterota bacterium]
MTDAEILTEVKKLQVLYRLKTVIRYHHTRDEEKPYDTESDAEHIYGMQVLARYFLALENPAGDWDREKVYDMILYHDIDEIETGDTIGFMKTSDEKSIELAATKRVIKTLPKSLQDSVSTLMTEYEAQSNIEAQFVKALDKIEPCFHLLSESGKATMQMHGTTLEQHWSIKRKPISPFPVLLRFTEVITTELEQQGHFGPATT